MQQQGERMMEGEGRLWVRRGVDGSRRGGREVESPPISLAFNEQDCRSQNVLFWPLEI